MIVQLRPQLFNTPVRYTLIIAHSFVTKIVSKSSHRILSKGEMLTFWTRHNCLLWKAGLCTVERKEEPLPLTTHSISILTTTVPTKHWQMWVGDTDSMTGWLQACCTAWTVHKLANLLPLLTKCYDCRCHLPHPDEMVTVVPRDCNLTILLPFLSTRDWTQGQVHARAAFVHSAG